MNDINKIFRACGECNFKRGDKILIGTAIEPCWWITSNVKEWNEKPSLLNIDGGYSPRFLSELLIIWLILSSSKGSFVERVLYIF